MTEKEPRNESRAQTERSPEYEKILGKLEYVLNGTQEEQQTFIQQRLDDLGKDAQAGELSHVGRGFHRGYLGPNMEIRRNLLVDPFLVDDPNLYAELFTICQKFKATEGWKDKSLRSMIPGAVQWTLSAYFGNTVSGSRTENQNRKFCLDHTTEESGAISLREFKGKGIAVCAEKGAAAQNLLAFVGIESDLIASSECQIPAEAEEGAHYFIVIHAQSGDMIYDPTNPYLVLDEKNQLTSYGPALYPLTQAQAQQLASGEPVTVEHTDTQIDASGQKSPQKSQRLYKGAKY